MVVHYLCKPFPVVAVTETTCATTSEPVTSSQQTTSSTGEYISTPFLLLGF